MSKEMIASPFYGGINQVRKDLVRAIRDARIHTGMTTHELTQALYPGQKPYADKVALYEEGLEVLRAQDAFDLTATLGIEIARALRPLSDLNEDDKTGLIKKLGTDVNSFNIMMPAAAVMELDD